MPNILSYNDVAITVLHATELPQRVVQRAVDITMRRTVTNKIITPDLCKYLLDADHTSVFEHVNYTFEIHNISRSLLAQITRHRMSSFTSASQHYQDYSDYPCIVAPDLTEHEVVKDALQYAFRVYGGLMQTNAKEEARQVLPNAAAVSLLWTINARSLINFLRHRLCNRNVLEMRIFANHIHWLGSMHFPELFMHVGPQCIMDECKQGKLQCKAKRWVAP